VNGHMDTVGVEGMTIDPFAAEVRDGRVWARGTSDCKGGLIVGLEAIRILLGLEVPLAGSLLYESVVDEECSGSGAGTLACLDAGYTGDGAIFVDGNDMTLTLGCGGCLTADVTVTGKEGHAARGTGVSAIDKGFMVKEAIDEFRREREAEHPGCRVNLGIFHSGVHAAVVPGSAYMSLNIVYDVTEAEQAHTDGYGWGGKPIRDHFERVIRTAEMQDDWLAEHPSELVWVKDLIPFDQPDSDPWAQRLAGVFREVLDEEPVFDRMMAWSDSAFPRALGGIPTVLFGPSTSGEAHGPAEHIEIAQMVRCTQVLAAFLADVLAA
jgi:acetylornithine deacetylase